MCCARYRRLFFAGPGTQRCFVAGQGSQDALDQEWWLQQKCFGFWVQQRNILVSRPSDKSSWVQGLRDTSVVQDCPYLQVYQEDLVVVVTKHLCFRAQRQGTWGTGPMRYKCRAGLALLITVPRGLANLAMVAMKHCAGPATFSCLSITVTSV